MYWDRKFWVDGWVLIRFIVMVLFVYAENEKIFFLMMHNKNWL